MRRIAAALLHFFKGGKSKFLLGRDAAPNPHVTFEIKVIVYAAYRRRLTPALFTGKKRREKPPEGFRSPRRNELRYAQYNQRLNCCTLRYCSLIEKNLRIFFEEEKQRKTHELSF